MRVYLICQSLRQCFTSLRRLRAFVELEHHSLKLLRRHVMSFSSELRLIKHSTGGFTEIWCLGVSCVLCLYDENEL